MPFEQGQTKSGGRKQGIPNRVNIATRERIAEEADPVGFLCRIVNGEEIGGQTPTLDQRLNAAKDLAKKVTPDLKSQDLHATVQAERSQNQLSVGATRKELLEEFELLRQEVESLA